MHIQDLRSESRHGADTTGTTRGVGPDAATWVRRAGLVVIVVSLFGAIFPYFSTAAGLPLDGAPNGALTSWRTVLHLVPGVVGVIAGVGLVDWSRRLRAGHTIANPKLVARVGMAAGAWFAVGPYIWSVVAPEHAVGTGGMAGMMGGMKMSWIADLIMPVTHGLEAVAPKMTTASCAITMGVCHWAVGGLIVLASVVALGAGAGTGPLASLRSEVERVPSA